MSGRKNIEIIAEIANAHQGNSMTAVNLATEAVKAGADAVKFQIYYADEFLVKAHPKFKHFKEQSFSRETWKYIFAKVKKMKIKVYADIFGLKAYKTAVENGVNGFKLHSSDISNTKLLGKVSCSEKKVFLATGGSTVLEIRYALDHVLKRNKPSEVILLHGFQSYPTEIKDSVLSRLSKLKELFGDIVNIGYSDHADADDKFAFYLPLAAIPFGVSYIEKHITFDRSCKGVDYYSSLEPREMKEFINTVRRIEQAIGDAPLKFSDSEKNYRNTVKKSWVASADLKKGTTIQPGDIIMKRTPEFVSPPLFEKIAGHRLLHSLKKDEGVTNRNIKHKVLAVIVARMESTRLPGKAVLDINGKPAICHLFGRIKESIDRKYIDTAAFCTTTETSDDRLVEIAGEYPVKIYRGSVEDVLSRMMLAIEDNSDHDIILRITGDDILIDPEYLKKTVDYYLKTNSHYTDAKMLPSGVEVEVFDAYILKLIYELSRDSSGTEYLTNYIKNNSDQFNISSLPVSKKHAKRIRLTLDTREDYEVIRTFLEHMKGKKKEFSYNLDDIVGYFQKHSKIFRRNRKIKHKSAPLKVNTEMDWQNLTKAPLVTVYITNHNYARFIKKAVNSALEQKFRKYELIIIDDGSTDNSKEVIEKYRNHPKIKIVFQHNRGLNVTNNIALKLARGKYIMRLDADDYLDENALLLMTDKLEKDGELGLVFPDYYYIDADGNVLGQERRHDFKNVTVKDQPAHGACTMIRKSALMEMGGYSEDFRCQDGYDIWVKFIKRFKVANINLPLFYYRQHDRSLTSNQDRLLTTRHEVIKKHVKHLNIKRKRHICVLPVRGGDEGMPMAIRPFARSTLLEIAVASVLNTENISKVILTTPDNRIINYAKGIYKEKIIIDRRPSELAALNTKLERTLDYLLKSYRKYLGRIDTVTFVNYEFPLRKNIYIDKAINALYLFDVDSVLSVKQRNANLYKHEGDGLKAFNTNKPLRLERDFIYEETGGIHTIRYESYLKYKSLTSGKVGHIIIDDMSSRGISSEIDLKVLEYLRNTEKGNG